MSIYILEPGEALTFRGNIPHGFEKLIELPICFLSIIHYDAPANEADTKAVLKLKLVYFDFYVANIAEPVRQLPA